MAALARSLWKWERARLPFNLVLASSASVAIEAMFARREWRAYLDGVSAPTHSWADLPLEAYILVGWANAFYCLVYPLDACLQNRDCFDATILVVSPFGWQ